ncbi:hypothetical protein DPMN_076312 [Dreissena polymorpha]|uniref:Uncharacterized protein n=1 Tax=Dreissena polymorpha TaxID=45954 RepID=A0A9D4BNA0_DREPO|nr:hypothetical protein DPMN_076312 [Dreissena polymorpha]
MINLSSGNHLVDGPTNRQTDMCRVRQNLKNLSVIRTDRLEIFVSPNQFLSVPLNYNSKTLQKRFQGSMAKTDGQTDGGDNHNEPVNSQLTLPTKHKLYVSGCGTIYTNCIRNNKTLRGPGVCNVNMDEADAYSHAACLTQEAPPGFVMRPCMVEIDRIVIRDFECLTERGFMWVGVWVQCIVVCQIVARTDGQTDCGDNHNEPVNSQLTLPTKHKLYVSGCGTIYTNCIRNNKRFRV